MSIAVIPPISSQNSGFFDVVNTGVTFSTSALRTEGGQASMVATATGSPRNAGVLHAAGKTVLAESFYFCHRNTGLATATIWQGQVAAGGSPVIRISTGNTLRAAVLPGGATSADSFVLTQDVWYRVDVLAKCGGATTTVDWWVNGAKQAQASLVQTATTFSQSLAGVLSSTTVTTEIMDWVISYTSGDAPLGEYNTRILPLTGTGTHHLAGTGAFKKTGAVTVDGTDTTSYLELIELPPSASDWVAQTGADSGSYLEYVQHNNSNVHAPAAVCILAQFQGASTTAYAMEIHLKSGANESADLAAAITKNSTTLRYLASQQPLDLSGGSWTVALWNSARLRFGYSTDVSPNPQLNSLGAICAYPNLRTHSGMVI